MKLTDVSVMLQVNAVVALFTAMAFRHFCQLRIFACFLKQGSPQWGLLDCRLRRVPEEPTAIAEKECDGLTDFSSRRIPHLSGAVLDVEYP
jgi:hypothetical protein